MSATQPAPADRRTFLGGSLALASAVAATAAPIAAVASQADQPDAGLLAACAAHLAAEARWKEIDAIGDEALNRYAAPPVPSALLYQGSTDGWLMTGASAQLAYLDRIEVDGAWRRYYASERDIGTLRRSLVAWRQRGVARHLIDRGEAIITALDGYVPEVERARAVAGVTAFDEMARENESWIGALVLEITTTPATTMQGVAAKARAACAEMSSEDGLRWLAEEAFPALMAGERDAGCFQHRTLAIVMSVIIDAARLGMSVDGSKAAA